MASIPFHSCTYVTLDTFESGPVLILLLIKPVDDKKKSHICMLLNAIITAK